MFKFTPQIFNQIYDNYHNYKQSLRDFIKQDKVAFIWSFTKKKFNKNGGIANWESIGSTNSDGMIFKKKTQ